MSIIRKLIDKQKENIIKQKNAIDAGQSKVVGTTEDGARIIENGDERFTVTEGLNADSSELWHGDPRVISPTEYKYQHRYFTVKDQDGNSKSLDIIVRKITHDYSQRGGVLALTSFYLGSTNPYVENETQCNKKYSFLINDLNNVNEIRYQLRDNVGASYFLDKFVIVTPEERKAYQKYAAEQEMKEKQAKEAEKEAARVEKIRARQERRDSRKQERAQKKEQKVQAKARLAEEAAKKALKQKIDEKFFGRK